MTDEGSLLIRVGDVVHRLADPDAIELLSSALSASSDGSLRFPGHLGSERESSFTQLLEQLVDLGVVVEDDTEASPSAVALLHEYRRRTNGQLNAFDLEARLASCPVYILGDGVVAGYIRDGLRDAGVSLSSRVPEQEISLSLVVTEDMTAREVADWNESRLAASGPGPWLLVSPFDGARAFVGPLIFPRQTACLECFRLRRISTFPDDAVSSELGSSTDITPRTKSPYSAVAHMQAGIAIEVTLDYVILGASGASSRPGFSKILRADGRGITLHDQRVLRVPRCTACSLGRGTGRPQIWFPYTGTTSDELGSS